MGSASRASTAFTTRLSFARLIVGEVGVALAEAVVVVDEVDGAQRAVASHLAHHAPNAVAVVRVVFHGEADAVVARGQEDAVGRHIPPHALVHHGFQAVGGGKAAAGFSPALGNVVFGKQLHGGAPGVAVVGGLHHGLSRRLVLMPGVGEVVQVELAVPVGHHGLVVVGPGALAAHGLDGMHAHHGLQSAVVALGTGHGLAAVVHHVAVVFDESLYKFLGGHEHGAVLVAHGEAHRAGLVLKGHEVFRAVGAVDAVAIGVVVDVPPVAHLCRRRTFGEALGEGLRRLAPRAVGTLGEGHLDVAHGARVVLHHHHVVVVASASPAWRRWPRNRARRRASHARRS